MTTNKVTPFMTRSSRLAQMIMRELRIGVSIYTGYTLDEIQKTNFISLNNIFQSDLTDADRKMIQDLEQNGLHVYHILLALGVDGQEIDIESEHSVSSFEKYITKTSYLSVPTDIYKEAITEDESLSEVARSDVINDFISHSLFMAKQGYVFAYYTNSATELGHFGYIEVRKVNDNLIKVD